MKAASEFAPAPGRWLNARARQTPRAVALEVEGATLDYAELDRRAAALASQLSEAGVRSGDVVAALGDNGVELPTLLWALHAIGAVLLPLNTRLATDELVHQVGDARPALVVSTGGERAAQAEAVIAGARDTSRARIDREGRLVGRGAVRRRASRTDALLEGAMLLLYTSGTTGRPKGAVLGAESLLASATASAALVGARSDDRWLLCMPLFHIGGLSILIRSCLAGGAALVRGRFDPFDLDHALDHDGVTGVSLVATMLSRLLDVRGDRPSPEALRCVLLGGGPTPVPLLERARAIGLPVAPTYGLTEAASQVATRLPDDGSEPLDARLRPLPGTRLEIVDDEGRRVAAGVAGEIRVAGETLMRGYLGLPDATAASLRGGWLHTGDVGVLDADGLLRVLDRREDLIVSGGENVYPAEIETVLLEHPGVAEAAVVGAPDPDYGSRPVAYFVAADPDGATSEALTAHCRAALAAYKVPVAFHRLEELPRGPSGKLLRRQLRSDSGARAR